MNIKRYINQSLLIVLGAGLLSCSDEIFEDINQDPNRPTSVPTTSLLVSAQKQLVDNIRSEVINLRGTQLFSQYYSQNIYTDQSRYIIAPSALDGFWAGSFKALNNLNEIIRLNTNETTKAIATAGVAGTNANQIAISRILKSYVFHNLTDVYGDVPYESYGNKDSDFEALQQNPDNYTPKYASQEKIYKDILNELKQAADTLNKYKTATTFGAADIVYNGSNEKWARFANSLRLRLSNRILAKEPALAKTHIDEALAQGVFLSNADNAAFKYASAAPNEAPLFRATVTANRKDYAVSHVLINVLKGDLGPVKSADPRLSIYALPNAKGEYVGQPYGLPLAAGGINTPTDISLPGAVINAANYAEVLQEYAEVEFLISEYKNWDSAAYLKGVKASLTKWGVSESAANAYIDKLPKADKENVLTQKYLALYTQGIEAWSEIRRTGYPLFLVKPGDTVWTRTTSAGVETYKFQPEFSNEIPRRLYYPVKEQSVNKANYQGALANQGDDVIVTKLWWNK
jgi:hypothetical protein